MNQWIWTLKRPNEALKKGGVTGFCREFVQKVARTLLRRKDFQGPAYLNSLPINGSLNINLLNDWGSTGPCFANTIFPPGSTNTV